MAGRSSLLEEEDVEEEDVGGGSGFKLDGRKGEAADEAETETAKSSANSTSNASAAEKRRLLAFGDDVSAGIGRL